MEAIAVAAVTGIFAVLGTWITVRRPMRREHHINVRKLQSNQESVKMQLDGVADKVDQTRADVHEVRADVREVRGMTVGLQTDLRQHVSDHATGRFHERVPPPG